MTAWWSFVLVIMSSIVSALGPVYLKKVSDEKIGFGLLRNKSFMLGVFLYGFGVLLMVLALFGGELSVLYPFISLTYVWVVGLSYVQLGEKISNQRILGVILILFSVVLLGVQ